MFHHRGVRGNLLLSELMMDKEFFIVSSMDISRIPPFLHLEDTFSIWVNLFMGNSGLFVIIFCVLVIFKEVVNTLKLDI